LAPRA